MSSKIELSASFYDPGRIDVRILVHQSDEQEYEDFEDPYYYDIKIHSGFDGELIVNACNDSDDTLALTSGKISDGTLTPETWEVASYEHGGFWVSYSNHDGMLIVGVEDPAQDEIAVSTLRMDEKSRILLRMHSKKVDMAINDIMGLLHVAHYSIMYMLNYSDSPSGKQISQKLIELSNSTNHHYGQPIKGIELTDKQKSHLLEIHEKFMNGTSWD